MSNRKRKSGINIRVTEQEKRRIERLAGRCKLSVSEYLRQLANGYAPKELPNDSLYDLCRQVEILTEDRLSLGDECFKSHLTGFLGDIQRVLYGRQDLTESELHAEMEKKVVTTGSPQSPLCGEKEHLCIGEPFETCAESDGGV